MKKNKLRLREFAIYALALVSMCANGAAAALAVIGKAFPDVGNTELQMIMTVPFLVMMPAAFLTEPLLKRFSIRQLGTAATAVMLVFGIAPFFLDSFVFIVLTRGVVGFAAGMIQVLLSLGVTTTFPVEIQGRVMGGKTLCSSLGLIFIVYVGGILADINWRDAFLPFIIALPVLVFVAIGLDDTRPKPSEKRPDQQADKRKKGRLDAITVFICIAIVTHNLFQQCYSNNVSLFMDAEGYGTATESGIAVAIFNISGMICGLLLARTRRLLKGKSMLIGFLSVAAGVLLTGLASSAFLVYVGGFFTGYGMSASIALSALDMTGAIPREHAPRAIAWLTVSVCIGQFAGPYVVNPLSAIFSNTVRSRFILCGILLIVQAVGYELIRKKKFADCYNKKIYIKRR